MYVDFRSVNTVRKSLMGPFAVNITVSSIQSGQRLHKRRTSTLNVHVHVCMGERRPERQASVVHESRRGWHS